MKRFVEIGSPVVSDVLRDLGHPVHAASPGIRPVNPDRACAGPIRTARFKPVGDDPGDFRPLARYIDSVAPGEVLAMAVPPGGRDGSLWGEICSTAALGHHAAGVVLDGLMRDERALAEIPLPLFSRGAYPRDTLGNLVIDAVDVDAEIGGIAVKPGDIVVADIDGVVFFDAGLIDAVLAAAAEKVGAEDSLLEAVRDGGSLYEAVDRIGTL